MHDRVTPPAPSKLSARAERATALITPARRRCRFETARAFERSVGRSSVRDDLTNVSNDLTNVWNVKALNAFFRRMKLTRNVPSCDGRKWRRSNQNRWEEDRFRPGIAPILWTRF